MVLCFIEAYSLSLQLLVALLPHIPLAVKSPEAFIVKSFKQTAIGFYTMAGHPGTDRLDHKGPFITDELQRCKCFQIPGLPAAPLREDSEPYCKTLSSQP